MSENSRPNEIKITRIYDAPVSVVWDAWSDPEKVKMWWGPRGFTLTTHSKSLKSGGHWNYTMHGPDGTDYPNRTVYHVVEKHKLLIYDHGATDDTPALFKMTVHFKEMGTRTQLEITMACATPEDAKRTKKFIKDAGGNATWDRLAEFVTAETASREIFVINRTFDGPVDLLFRVWTEPKHFCKWLGPAGSTMEFIDSEIAVGKTTFYKMSYDSGLTMFGKMTYTKIEPLRCVEYVQIFCDEHGNLSKHPLVPVWPDKMLTRISFAEEGANSTRVTVVWQPDESATTQEILAFVNLKPGMTQGWTQSFDKLDELVEAHR